MKKRINTYLENLSNIQILTISVSLVILIGGFDYVTGYELSFSIFYLAPIALATWYTGFSITIAICILSALTWLLIDQSTGHQYSNLLIPYWNGLVRLGFFAIMARLLWIIKLRLKVEEHLARSDGLTGLLNARAFLEVFSTFLDLAKRHNHFLTLAYIDLDNFKKVNDTLGHLEGDRVLVKISDVLTAQKRSTDFVARLGGDEFAILLPETDISGASSALNTTRERLMQVIDENDWPIGLSIGVAIFKNTQLDVNQAINLADNLMYQVKKQGKNNILFDEVQN